MFQIDLSENERTDRNDGGAEAELRPERLRLSLQAGAQQRGSQTVRNLNTRSIFTVGHNQFIYIIPPY